MVHGMYAIVYHLWKGKEFKSVTIDLYCLALSLSKHQYLLQHACESMHPPRVCIVHSNTAVARFPVLANGWALVHCSMVHEAVFSEITCRTQQSRFDYLVGMLTRHAPDINMAKVSGWVGGSVGRVTYICTLTRRTQNILTHQILLSQIRV